MSVTIKEAIEQNGQILHFTKGISMKPMLTEGENPVVVGRLTRALKKRDVVLFDGDSDCVLHRIVKIKKGMVVTRGDNNLFYDRMISVADVYGIMLGYYKGDKYIDCQKNIGYKLYSFFVPLRHFAKKVKTKIAPFVPIFLKKLIRSFRKKQ